MIEILPGMEVHLRGSAETQEAILSGFLAGPVTCSECTLRIDCIRDAAYILCPLCHAITPLGEPEIKSLRGPFGVGLGFIYHEDEDLIDF